MIIDPPAPSDSAEEWQGFLDEILAIIHDKGTDILKSDLATIDTMLASLPADKRPEIDPWIYEGLALIVNDCPYHMTATMKS